MNDLFPHLIATSLGLTDKQVSQTIALLDDGATIPFISRYRKKATGGLDEVIADHQNLLNAIERCDLAAVEPLVERHLYGGIRRLGSKLTEEYADYFEPETAK